MISCVVRLVVSGVLNRTRHPETLRWQVPCDSNFTSNLKTRTGMVVVITIFFLTPAILILILMDILRLGWWRVMSDSYRLKPDGVSAVAFRWEGGYASEYYRKPTSDRRLRHHYGRLPAPPTTHSARHPASRICLLRFDAWRHSLWRNVAEICRLRPLLLWRIAWDSTSSTLISAVSFCVITDLQEEVVAFQDISLSAMAVIKAGRER